MEHNNISAFNTNAATAKSSQGNGSKEMHKSPLDQMLLLNYLKQPITSTASSATATGKQTP